MKAKVSFLILFLIPLLLSAQNFSLQSYKEFLNSNLNMSPDKLYSLYDAGKFNGSIGYNIDGAKYFDSIKIKYELTEDEIELLKKNGFVVTERISGADFLHIYLDLYKNDIPAIVTTDAILNAFHLSYDVILKEVEIESIIPKLKVLLKGMHEALPQLESKYGSIPELVPMLKDAEVYTATALKLLGENYELLYQDNKKTLDELSGLIDNLSAAGYPLFSSQERKIDFSQFKVRGHYEDTYYPELASYFKTMIWLGRTELYLIPPEEAADNVAKENVQRQIIDAFLISELVETAGVYNEYASIDNLLKAFVGEQDNVTLEELREVFNEAQVQSAVDLLDTNKVNEFQNILATKPYADQKILSQILMSDPMSPEQIKPASAFLLFGQRFVIDSYITNNVTYDRILYNNEKIRRMLPSLLDVMFALGNSAAAQLLKDELEQYHYSANIASLRYLIDSYTNEFWNASIYNSWLNSIRSLNPPEDRSGFPEFMQTAAWWQQKLNTQLSAWTELRHDNLLYAKQSYSGGVVCSFPHGYVEPFPQFYERMKTLAENTYAKLENIDGENQSLKNYFSFFGNVMDTLKTIAEKELNSSPLNENEIRFLKNLLYENMVGCAPVFNGWYYHLIYKSPYGSRDEAPDLIAADYHTSPTDELGNVVGWVKHAGTGRRNLMIVAAEHPNEGLTVFAGPVNSYYEYVTNGFYRIGDSEWEEEYLDKAQRPEWTNVYLADSEGRKMPSGAQLITSVERYEYENAIIPSDIYAQNFPNPFNISTIINFSVPSSMTGSRVKLNIYNINGELIKTLVDEELQAGNYSTQWNGTNQSGNVVSSGIYLYEVRVGNLSKIGKMNLLK
ncbi:hypothetical protein MROS_0377 [Melioribacter roseus P3M-2]|uniref:FlgD/Vpr Ig-like domain-containing protein n=1 Tax=Melioribacter roseus (strain DSM 23840 / JCM 17771 / VKM B-2668 / P3M-2) TaxID=1191523 RepID=I7A0X8_MELRP|nr:DUF3160 domain-containing protein [Melioribacter roseus]AFN73621.1 hypothetical protein MROS_0377 [Melioribacter roseus P3M-2]